MNDQDIAFLKAAVSKANRSRNSKVLYNSPDEAKHYTVVDVRFPPKPEDGVQEPCECAMFSNGQYACLDNMELSRFVRTQPIT